MWLKLEFLLLFARGKSPEEHALLEKRRNAKEKIGGKTVTKTKGRKKKIKKDIREPKKSRGHSSFTEEKIKKGGAGRERERERLEQSPSRENPLKNGSSWPSNPPTDPGGRRVSIWERRSGRNGRRTWFNWLAIDVGVVAVCERTGRRVWCQRWRRGENANAESSLDFGEGCGAAQEGSKRRFPPRRPAEVAHELSLPPVDQDGGGGRRHLDAAVVQDGDASARADQFIGDDDAPTEQRQRRGGTRGAFPLRRRVVVLPPDPIVQRSDERV